jgi:hypothetical protein
MNNWRQKLLWNISPEDFKAGDTVRVIKEFSHGGVRKGSIGTIIEKQLEGWWVVEFPNDGTYIISEFQMERIPRDNNTLL